MKPLILLITFIFTSQLLAGDFTETKNLKLNTESITEFNVRSGAGFLKIVGKEGLSEIRVQADIYIDHIDTDEAGDVLDKYMDLILEKRGSTAVLQSYFEENEGVFRHYDNARIDLTVEIPNNLHIIIHDGSGAITVTQSKGDLEISDGSGNIEVIYVSGDVKIGDGSGGILLEHLGGNVFIDDGSGSMTIKDINGSIEIHDGSGSISIEGVDDDVIIKESGSGSVSIAGVKGKVKRYDRR